MMSPPFAGHRRRQLLGLFAAAATASLAGCNLRYALFGFPAPKVAAQWPAAGADGDAIELPFRIGPGGLVLLRGRVNNRADLEFILDTGAPVSVLVSDPATAALGLDTRHARKLGPDDNPAAPIGVIAPDFDIDFGAVRIAGLTAVVIEGRALPCPERFAAVGFNGVIGADLFRHFVVEVDHARQQLRLFRPGTAPQAKAATVPLVFDDGHIFIDAAAQIGDQRVPLHLHVDTGKNTPLMLIAGSRPELVMPTDGATRVGCLVQGTWTTRAGAPLALEIGGVRTPALVPYYDTTDRVLSRPRNGAIGVDLLRHFVFTIDYPGRRLWLLQRG